MSSDAPFVVDLHAHYPMKFDPEAKDLRGHLRRQRERHERLWDKIRFWGLEIADRFLNREHVTDGHAVTIDTLSKGNVGVALSVAYNPVDEFEIEPWPAPPKNEYFKRLTDLLDKVEAEVVETGAGRARVVRNFAELRAARAAGEVAMVHAIEGGFHIGHDEQTIRARADHLAERGVAYVTVAHLFFRRVATNAPAIPFLPDAFYGVLFPQANDLGLDERGRLLVREMVRRGILIDVSHMSKQSMRDTFEMLDRVDPKREVPIIASHVACSFGKLAYNLEREWVERIAERKGMCGITYCDHFVRDGRGARTETFRQSFDFIESQIEKLREWGGDDVPAIGSDLDGFIKPALAGLSSALDHDKLARRLVERYGKDLAAKICHGNAMRVLERGWMKPFEGFDSPEPPG